MGRRRRLAAYLRVSSEDQARDGVSIAAQRERLEAWARAHRAELVAVDSDEGVSGSVAPARRAGLSRALARLRAGEVDGLVVVALDRLSRRVRDVIDLADEFARRGWELVSMVEHIDTSSPTGRFTIVLLGGLAQLEREQASDRTREGLRQVAREGRARSRYTPLGWRLEDGTVEVRRGGPRHLVEDPHEQDVLARVAQLRGRGFGARRIARQLNESGIPNPRTGQPWAPWRIAEVLALLDRRDELHA